MNALVTATSALTLCAALALSPASALASMVWSPPDPVVQAYEMGRQEQLREEARFDDHLLTPEVKDLLGLLDNSNPRLEQLEPARLKVGSACLPL